MKTKELKYSKKFNQWLKKHVHVGQKDKNRMLCWERERKNVLYRHEWKIEHSVDQREREEKIYVWKEKERTFCTKRERFSTTRIKHCAMIIFNFCITLITKKRQVK